MTNMRRWYPRRVNPIARTLDRVLFWLKWPIAIVALVLAPGHHLELGGFVLGATVGYHIWSTWSETHRHQSDLREVGWVFSTVFLVAANAFVLGLLIAYACGQRSLTAHLEHVRGPSAAVYR